MLPSPTLRPRAAFPRILGVLLAAAWTSGPGASVAQTAQPDNVDARLIADFQTRVKEYAALHEKLEGTLAPLAKETTPERIEEHQQALERLITRARGSAKQGDIFTPDIRAYFRRQLSRVFSGPDGRQVLQSIRDEDTRALRLVVNGRYPSTAPLSSVPPQVLLLLPRLPEQLEYHFVGDRLVLLDIHAATVVDLMEKAVPR